MEHPQDSGRSLSAAATLPEELAANQVRISASGHDSYGAQEGEHGDLAPSLALVTWYGTESGVKDFVS